jgi:hypothetical protein
MSWLLYSPKGGAEMKCEGMAEMDKPDSGVRWWAMLAAFGLLVCCTAFAHADYVYDEAVDGDLPHPSEALIIPFGSPNPDSITFVMDLYSDGWIVEIGPDESLDSFTLTEFLPLEDPESTAAYRTK